jgi:dual-action HEIGH metallo-peptidase
MKRMRIRSFALATAVLSTVLAVFVGASDVSANHTTFLEQHTFETFMDASQVWGTFPPGAARPIAVCTDGLNAYPNAKTAFRNAVGDWNVAAGFQAFWLRGSGEFFGPCNGSEQLKVYWTSTSGCTPNWIGCNDPGPADPYGGLTSDTIEINSTYSYTSDGLKAVMTHELGHAFGLGEQYIEGTGACGSNVSIMESATLSAASSSPCATA